MLGLKLALRIGRDIIDVIGKLLSKLAFRSTYSENLAASRSIISKFTDYNILDKASILLTPTAYSDARVHSVKTYTGDELVTNGTFDTDSDWTIPIGWSIANGVATVTNTINQQLRQPLTFANGKTYKISFEITEITQGSLRVYLRDGGNQGFVGGTYNTVGVKEFVVKATTTSDTLAIYPTSTTTASIDNISVLDVSSDFAFDRASSATRINSDGLVQDMQSITDPELVLNGDFEELGDDAVTNGTFDTDSDWSKGTGWTISGGKAIYTGTANASLNQSNALISGKFYKLQYEVISSSLDGDFKISGVTEAAQSPLSQSVGTHTVYFTADGTAPTNLALRVVFNTTGTLEIDNVSVQQVDPNNRWTVTNSDADNYVEFTEGFARLKFLNTSPITTLNSTLVLEANKTYELVVDVHDVTSGGIKIDAAGMSEVFDTEGVTTRYLKPTGNSTLSFYRATANVDITLGSVSVKDITFSTDVDLARINYDSNGENGHWLLEPTSTNIIPYSEDFSEWELTFAVTVEGGYLAPDGSNNAYKVSGTVGSSSIYSPGVNATDTRTIWAKTVSGTGQAHLCSYFGNTNNLKTITNEWQRFEVNGTTTATGAANFYAIDFRGSTDLSEIIIWGAQSEALPYATSYIPTYGSTVTRAEETLTGSGNSTLINSTEGVLYAEIAAFENTNTDKNISISNGTNSNRIGIYYYGNTMSAVGYLGGANQFYLAKSITDVKEFIRVAVKYNDNDFALWIDGEQIGTDTSGTVPSGLNSLQFDNGGGSGDFYGNCKALAVFDEALTDDELELLTGITNYGSFSELAQANGYTII